MAIDFDHVPAVGFETLRGIVEEPALDLAVDRDSVVVPESDQLAETEGPRERTGLVRYAFHHAAVTHEYIGEMIDNVEIVTIELGRQRALGDCHADGIADSLAERPGRGLDSRRVTVLGVARRLRMQLAKIFQVFDGDFVTGQVQHRVCQHRPVPVRHDEAIAIAPLRIGGVVTHEIVVQDFRDVSHSHRGSRMTGIGFLHGIHA